MGHVASVLCSERAAALQAGPVPHRPTPEHTQVPRKARLRPEEGGGLLPTQERKGRAPGKDKSRD